MMNEQVDEGIEKVFTIIKKFPYTLIKEFKDHLEKNLKLTETRRTNRMTTNKIAVLNLLQKRITDKSFDTFEILYKWIERKQQKLGSGEKKAIDNRLIEVALTKVFEHQRINRPLCDENKFYQFLAARYIRIADKKKTGLCASLEVLLEESVEEIKTKCIKYLKTKPFPLDRRQVKSILKEDKTIDSHISDLESSDVEDPFIFYAASIVYRYHIHVLCAAEEGLEEYVFYPSKLPSERASCCHIFIGHLYGNNYVSLENMDLKLRNYKEELEKTQRLVREKESEIEKLEEENKNLKEEIGKKNEEICGLRAIIKKHEKRIKELEAKLQEMERKNVERDESFKRLQQHTENIEKQLHNLEKLLQDRNISSMSNRTNSQKAMDNGKGEANNRVQVQSSAQNNVQRDVKTGRVMKLAGIDNSLQKGEMTSVEDPELSKSEEVK